MHREDYLTNAASAVLVGIMASVAVFCSGCKSSEESAKDGKIKVVEGTCEIATNAEGTSESDGSAEDCPSATKYLTRVGCMADFQALASAPLSSSLPGARSVKVVLDTQNNHNLYFQNSCMYPIHHDFASANLPDVADIGTFNGTEYSSATRRFVLGAVTYYEGPQTWALELAPYDTAAAEMMTTLYTAVKNAAFFGPALYFHPTSDAVTTRAKDLSSKILVVSTNELYAGIDYQPLTLATGIGEVIFVKAAQLSTMYLSPKQLVVMDEVPNDISVVRGIVSEEFQTPLSHVNVLCKNRKTPNMGLRGAWKNKKLRSYEGKLAKLTVGSNGWEIEPATQEEAEASWDASRPAQVKLDPMNLEVTDLLDIEKVTPEPALPNELRAALKEANLAWGGKAAQYSVLARTDNVPLKEAFAVPIYYYQQFMTDNGFYDELDALLADPRFTEDSAYRFQKLKDFRDRMLREPVDTTFQERLKAKISERWMGGKVRFRTSTNSEDLDGFPCAGCYESQSGDPADWEDILDAVRLTWSSVWLFRTYEERDYYRVDQTSVGMALLVHNDFPEEEANGVAVTENPYDLTRLNPAFYINVQFGGFVEVVHPLPGVFSDQFLLYYDKANEPTDYLSHSNLVPKGWTENDTVLTRIQIHQLAVALKAIHERFTWAYGSVATPPNYGWYAMDVEFKYDDYENPGQPAKLYIKQARPYPEPGL